MTAAVMPEARSVGAAPPSGQGLEAIESGAPASDARAFRRCLGQFATGVTVVTAASGEHLAGMTANSFSALSLDPPLVLWSIRRESVSLPVFTDASHYAVNVLAADQVPLSNLFASPGAQKFESASWTPGRGGAPLIDGAVAHFQCRLDRTIEAGDHVILIGEVEQYARFPGDPLLFTQGRYALSQEHPGVQPPAASPPSGPPDAGEGGLLRLLHYASYQMSSAFDSERRVEGVSVAQRRIAGWLRTRARDLDEIHRLAYLGERDARDTVDAMLERGELTRDQGGVLALTEIGRKNADAMAVRSAAFEASLLEGLPATDLAAARRVLTTLGARAFHRATAHASKEKQ